MKNVFTPKTDTRVRPNDIFVKSHKLTNYGENPLPRNVKPKTCFTKFKEYIDTWFGPEYKCKICALTHFIEMAVKMEKATVGSFSCKYAG